MVREQAVVHGRLTRAIEVLQKERRSQQLIITGLLSQAGGCATIGTPDLEGLEGTRVHSTPHENGTLTLEIRKGTDDVAEEEPAEPVPED